MSTNEQDKKDIPVYECWEDVPFPNPPKVIVLKGEFTGEFMLLEGGEYAPVIHVPRPNKNIFGLSSNEVKEAK